MFRKNCLHILRPVFIMFKSEIKNKINRHLYPDLKLCNLVAIESFIL